MAEPTGNHASTATNNNEIVDLLMSDDDADNNDDEKKRRTVIEDTPPPNPPSAASYSVSLSSSSLSDAICKSNNNTNTNTNTNSSSSRNNTKNNINTNISKRHRYHRGQTTTKIMMSSSDGLQAGLVLEEDIFAATVNNNDDGDNDDVDGNGDGDDNNNNSTFELFEDDEFGPVASSIKGIHNPSIADVNFDDNDNDIDINLDTDTDTDTKTRTKTDNNNKNKDMNKWNPKCRCNILATLSYKEKDGGTPYFQCGKVNNHKSKLSSSNNDTFSSKNKPTKKGNNNNNNKCKFYTVAFKAELTPWYRFGHHNRHVIVHQQQQHLLSSSTLLPLKLLTTTATNSTTRNNNNTDNNDNLQLFSAQDLVQGKVGDCWFLSALAVVAERPDLIQRLFQQRSNIPRLRQTQTLPHHDDNNDLRKGIVRLNLFLDGKWKQIKIDNFLPCYIRNDDNDNDDLQKAIEASLLLSTMNGNNDNNSGKDNNHNSVVISNPYAKKNKNNSRNNQRQQQYTKLPPASLRNDPTGLSEKNRQIMIKTIDFIDSDRKNKKLSSNSSNDGYRPRLLGAVVGDNRSTTSTRAFAQTRDLAYSKSHKNQLWVPFLEKAYAKIHGSYQAISGGHIAEAFLDLTGAPTLQIGWHAGRAISGLNSNTYDDPKKLWNDLLNWRSQRLPMGCATDRSASGLVGMHAYSILDVREIINVGVDFFKDHLLHGTLGNVSGFIEYDGKVRLLRIRNPHGQGEWKGEFSDKCAVWEQLLANSGITLPRTMANDGTFWIGYDDFLLGFSNIDVVLAHQGNHAKSFVSNFPQKKSNHRCTRAFEVSLIDPQPGLITKERVEIYVMGIQKSKRGARQGRSDRKKSYKVSDMGMLVGEYPLKNNDDDDDDDDNNIEINNNINANTNDNDDVKSIPFSTVHGQMFGFKRNGHYKLVLDRKKCRRLVVMPISFGHPAATDALLSFVVRFNANAPLMIRELEEVPRIDRVLCDYLIRPKPSGYFADTRQGQKKVVWENSKYRVVQVNCLGNGGGTIFVYLCASPTAVTEEPISLGIEATCRGMSCRVEGGLLVHETIAKGKKFEAAWRKYKIDFIGKTTKSQLLMVLYQSGQDTEMGSITVQPIYTLGNSSNNSIDKSNNRPTLTMSSTTLDRYWKTKTTGNSANTINNEKTNPQDTHEYKLQGIFNPICVDDNTFRHCGENREVFESLSRAQSLSRQRQYHPHEELLLYGDTELQKALALSRQDQHDVQHPDNSKDLAADTMLEEALKRSCQNQGGRYVITRDIDKDLEDALRRSREDAFARKEDSSINQTIDLTTTYTKVSIESNKNESAVVVLDLTDNNDGSVNGSKENVDSTGSNSKKGNEKEILILDSDDEEEDSNNTKKSHCEGNNSKRKEVDEHGHDREKKRKLAAEAALKRLEGGI